MIDAGAGDDVVIGGQGGDRITGGDGDDDLIGGHNVAGGADGADVIDGGAGNDWIAGDNADIRRTGSRRQRAVPRRCSGDTIYDTDRPGPARRRWEADPNPANEERQVVLFDHSTTRRPARGATTSSPAAPSDDVIFGQLGDDWIQGDGCTTWRSTSRRAPASRSRTSPGPGTDGHD